jgi:hypothetical protein
LEVANVTTGLGHDLITVENTHAGTTTVNTGEGSDRIAIRTIEGATEEWRETRMERRRPGAHGTVNGIHALLTIDAVPTPVEDWLDQLTVDDTGDYTDTGTLTVPNQRPWDDRWRGDYTTFEDLHINPALPTTPSRWKAPMQVRRIQPRSKGAVT